MGKPGHRGKRMILLSPTERELVTVEAPAGKVPSHVIMPDEKTVRPDERGRITIPRLWVASLINTAGWRLVTDE